MTMFAPTQRRCSEKNMNDSDCTKMKCRCGLQAALKVSSSGRKYLGCPRAASGQCEFTLMLPENVQEAPSPTYSPNTNHMEGSRNEIIDPIFTAHLPSIATLGPANPMKRTPPAMDNGGNPQLLPSQKRARIIEAVLRESVQDSSAVSQKQITAIEEALCRSNSRSHDGAPPFESPDPIPALPSDFSRADTPDTKYQEVRAETIALSVHVNGSSQSVGTSSGRMDPPSLDSVPSSRAVNTDKAWLLHTPKRTEFERSASNTSVLSSPEASPVETSKGKHRANEEWYKENASPGVSPSKKRYSVASVTNTLEGLSGLPTYLLTLEKDLEIKDMKIKHLENEIQRLNSKQGELEKLLQMYEQHSSLIDHVA